MHELSLAQGIVDIVAEHAQRDPFARLLRVTVRLGDLSHVEPDALAFGFAAASRGTVADGAALVIERVPGRARCDGCAALVAVAGWGEPCPRCGSLRWALIEGKEMRVVEMEVA